ncbi:MAG TPA: DUF1552 domain-containing protein [Polyangia bacterium]|nr:DUF1552 domain-containing protein [Polyangia bacterium]
MSNMTFSRRALMRTFAGLGAAAQFRGLLRDAYGQAMPTAPRFVVLNNPHGYDPTLWRPRAPGGGDATEKGWVLDFDPDSSLGPLEPHKDSLVIIEGLDLLCNFDQSPIYTGHNGGTVAPLTGRHGRTPEGGTSVTTDGSSIDYFVASQLKVAPFLFNPLGYSGNSTFITYDNAGNRVPNEYEFPSSLSKWFGNFMGGGAQPMVDPKAAARLKADTAVLTHLNAEAKTLRIRLGGRERLKLDGHIDALNLLQQRLSGTGTLAPSTSCGKPTKTDAALGDADLINTMLRFATQVLACNLTRVSTMSIDPAGSGKMPWLMGETKIHDDVAHGWRADDPASGRKLSKVHRWYAQQVADFIVMLKAMPEGNGTVYDNTIILWSNELGDPSRHMNNNLPFVLAGGGGTYKKGRYLKFGVMPEYRDSKDPHNRLLVSLANQYGANVTAFGDPRYTGELPGFLG